MSDPVILLARHYDRVAALLDGRVRVGDRKLRCEVAPSIPDSFRRMMSDPDILAGEMSFGFQTVVASSQTGSRFIAIPVFPSRSFRHGNVFVRRDSALNSFEQLRGKKVGLEEYAMTMGIWVRALFEGAGVVPEEIHWVTGRDPVVVPEVEAELRKRLHLDRASRSLWDLLKDGEIDAVIGRPPDYRAVEGGAFRRLLGDHWHEQREYYRATGIFPPMHVLVVRRDAFESNPEIALELYAAFDEAKRLAVEDMSTNLNAITVTLPMLEAHVDATRALFGDDWWPYGIAKNRKAIDAFLAYCFRQGLTQRQLGCGDIFCSNTLHL